MTDAALTAALKATRLALTWRERDQLVALRKFGSEGFRALCLLLEIGHHHHRTVDLLEQTHSEGDGKYLMTLVDRRPLPRYADWTVLDALGIEPSKKAEAYLLEALRSAEDAGVFA